MKTYELLGSNNSYYIKTTAEAENVQQAIDFVPDKDIDKILQALRIQGFKATQVKLEPVDVFEL